MSAQPAHPEPVETPEVSVASARRIHLSEDWLATVVGLALVALGLFSLLPQGLAA